MFWNAIYNILWKYLLAVWLPYDFVFTFLCVSDDIICIKIITNRFLSEAESFPKEFLPFFILILNIKSLSQRYKKSVYTNAGALIICVSIKQ